MPFFENLNEIIWTKSTISEQNHKGKTNDAFLFFCWIIGGKGIRGRNHHFWKL